jgi:hypothetical protein
MADAELHRLWAAVIRDFNQAREMLPIHPRESEGSMDRLTEWLDHNELELALDELEALGEDNDAPKEYWHMLAVAAERMKLEAHQARLAKRGI